MPVAAIAPLEQSALTLTAPPTLILAHLIAPRLHPSRPMGDRLETVSGLGAGCDVNRPDGEG